MSDILINRLSMGFKLVEFSGSGRRAVVSIRSGGKNFPWKVHLAISKELAREIQWPGATHVIIGASVNPTLKHIEIRTGVEDWVGSRAIHQSRTLYTVEFPYNREIQKIIPEIKSGVDVTISVADAERLILDFSGIKSTGMPVRP